MNPRRICLLLLLLMASSCSVENTDRPKTTTTHAAAAAAYTDLHGNAVDPLHPSHAANVLVFIRTDCPISNAYTPIINDLMKADGSRGADFFIIYTTRDLPLADAQTHYQSFGYTCPAIIDHDHSLVKKLGAIATPDAFVIAPDGSIAYQGRIDDSFPSLGKQRPKPTTHELADAIDAVVAGTPVAVAHTRTVGCAISDD